MTLLHRDDFRLGAPVATGPALDHLCPICEGEGDVVSVQCYCSGLGVITADQARAFGSSSADPRWQPRPLPPVPGLTGKRCADCAFRPDSPERDGGGATELYLSLGLGSETDQPFYCHTGMHHGGQGYVPLQRDARGAPLGHPVCAGWLQHYRKGALVV